MFNYVQFNKNLLHFFFFFEGLRVIDMYKCGGTRIIGKKVNIKSG